MKHLSAFTLTVASVRGISAFETPETLLNWTPLWPCAVDFPSRVLSQVITTQLGNNTPAVCIELCDASVFDITLAGVEYGNECHCGTGFAATAQQADDSECKVPCAGDPTLSCGGSWRIQIYQSPALPGNPANVWHPQGCYIDDASSPAFLNTISYMITSDVDALDQCNQFCQHRGHQWSGVENGTECLCGVTLNPGAERAAGLQDCEQALCPLPNNEGVGPCGGPSRVWVSEYQFFS